jgi:hypothetical protein
MIGGERRKEDRIKVRFPCEFAFGRQRASGTVLDLSPAGLSVAVDSGADQGDKVRVRLQPRGRSSIDIEALVWNTRGMRRRGTGKQLMRLGLVLSEAPDEFLELLKSHASAGRAEPPRAAASRPPEPEIDHGAETRETPPEACRFRARVKQSSSTRTRAILVFAESPEDAAEKALAEAGAAWSLLEVASG